MQPLTPARPAKPGLLHRLLRDEEGGELLEYALIAGLIIMAAIAAIKLFSSSISSAFRDMGDVVTNPEGE